jgi:hypothetical protein
MLNEILNFSKEIKDLKGIQSIILLFSGDKGKSKGSNLNLTVIYAKKNEETVHKINSLKPPQLKITQISREELKDDPQYIDLLSGEGMLLYGQPITLKAEDTYLKAKMIISYDTSPLKQIDRSRLNRALYGGVSTYLQNGERLKKYYPGLVEQLNVQKIGKAVLILNRLNAFGITQTLQKYGAQWHEIPIWSL